MTGGQAKGGLIGQQQRIIVIGDEAMVLEAGVIDR